MNVGATSKIEQFRRSPLVQRIGSAILAGSVIVYLAVITYSFADRLQSTRGVVTLAVLWCLGIVALVLLSCPWRNLLRSKKNHSQDSP